MRKTVFGVFRVLFIALLGISSVHAQDDNLPALPGRVAFVGTDYNIYTLNLADDSQVQLTEDAGELRRYQWPTWSTDGRLAYFSTYLEDGNLFTGAYISQDGQTQGDLVYSGPELFNYAYWSPGNCALAERCRDLAILFSSSARGMFVELVRDGLEEVLNLTAGLGGPPFYYSWSPDGSRMLWQRNNQRFDIYDAGEDRVTRTLEQIPGFILAPAWSPVDDRLLFGTISDDNTTDLMIVGEDENQTLAQGFTGLLSFQWSPDGNRIAYREQTAQGFGALVVVDAVTAEVVARSPTTGVISFFWSPDSQRVAYLTLAAPPDSFSARSGARRAVQESPSVGIAWSVLNVNEGAVQQFGSFFPTQETVYLMQYFDQFAQSHRVWSPDSRHLIYSEVTSSGPVINLLDTSQAGSIPLAVAEGVVGIWSFG